MYKYYIAAQTDSGLIAYIYNLNYKIDTEQGIKKITNQISEEYRNAVIIFFKELI